MTRVWLRVLRPLAIGVTVGLAVHLLVDRFPWLLPGVLLVALVFMVRMYRDIRQAEKEIGAHLRHLTQWARAVDHAHHRNPRPRRWPEP